MDSVRKDVVVIGAGISGLVCAYRLKSLGFDVLLLEKSDRVGGVMQTEIIDGYQIERGPNSSQGTEELLALVEELGITSELAEGDPKAPAYVYFKGQLHPVPSSPGAFIRSKLLSAKGKLRIFKEPFIARAPLKRGRINRVICPTANRERSRRATGRAVRVRHLRRGR